MSNKHQIDNFIYPNDFYSLTQSTRNKIRKSIPYIYGVHWGFTEWCPIGDNNFTVFMTSDVELSTERITILCNKYLVKHSQAPVTRKRTSSQWYQYYIECSEIEHLEIVSTILINNFAHFRYHRWGINANTCEHVINQILKQPQVPLKYLGVLKYIIKGNLVPPRIFRKVVASIAFQTEIPCAVIQHFYYYCFQSIYHNYSIGNPFQSEDHWWTVKYFYMKSNNGKGRILYQNFTNYFIVPYVEQISPLFDESKKLKKFVEIWSNWCKLQATKGILSVANIFIFIFAKHFYFHFDFLKTC